LALFLLPFLQPDTGATAVLVDEFYAGRFRIKSYALGPLKSQRIDDFHTDEGFGFALRRFDRAFSSRAMILASLRERIFFYIRYAASALSAAFGFLATMVSNERAAGSGRTRPCSQLRSVASGILIALANSACVIRSCWRKTRGGIIGAKPAKSPSV
jgi:hypothetical protein